MKYLLFLLFLFVSMHSYGHSITVADLKCEGKRDSLGIEQTLPNLSWQLRSHQRGIVQTAYRVIVSDNPESLESNEGNVWDSKKVNSDASINVAISGQALRPAKKYYWKVMVWDNKNNFSPWSKAANWQMGLLSINDWKGAKWIAFEKLADSNITILPVDGKKDKYTGNNVLPLLRKDFSVNKTVKKATIFISGLGQFELSLNGRKVGDHFLDPGWTKYDKQALYVTFDITPQLRQGANAIGVMLGNGFYYVPPVSGRYRKLKTAFGYPKMISRVLIEYADGTEQSIISDNSWKTAKGPITFSSIYGGEDYDANLEHNGWNTPGFNDDNWKPVIVVDGPSVLNSQMEEPLKVMETFKPAKVTSLQPNSYVFDLGQNASGIPRISLKGRKGDTIRIYPAELLKADGSANQRATGSPYYLQYILKGQGVETWEPRFTYYGFRYLQINGVVIRRKGNAQKLPVVVNVKGLHTRNAAERSGEFQCSNGLFNKTNTLIDWAIKNNMASLFTDCPHREKLGWLEQDHLMGNSIQYNYNVADLFTKQLADIRYSQNEDGLIPEIAPEYVKFEWGGDMFRDSPEWGSAGIIIPWYLYQWYGDKQVLEKNYATMQKYSNYLQQKAKGHILSQGLGDWYDLGPKPPGVSQLTPMGVTGTAMYYYDLSILTNIANLLSKQDDAKKYQQLAGKVKQAFNDTFFHKETMQYGTGSQTANAMAVFMKLVEPQYKDAVVQNIVKDIRSRNNSLTAGDIGYRYLLKVLHDEGRSDVIFDMNSNPNVPGYGYQLAQGATALTESWAALPTNSNDHFMLGHLMEWFYAGLAGISQAENSIAYKEVVIKPEVVGNVTSATATYKSSYGVIFSSWKIRSNTFQLKVNIPANTTATIYLPAKEDSKITESKKLVTENKDIKFVGFKKGRAVYKVGSGNYVFVVQ